MKGLTLRKIAEAVGGELYLPEEYVAADHAAGSRVTCGTEICSGASDRGVTDSVATDSGATDRGASDSGVSDSGVSDSVATERGAIDCKTVTGVVIDSRKLTAGNLFVATVGERVDGHDFINQVFEKGALGVICERLPECTGSRHDDAPAQQGDDKGSRHDASTLHEGGTGSQHDGALALQGENADYGTTRGTSTLPGPCILVKDSFVALKKLAAYYRRCIWDIRIVGIVGSVGKTSTKEIVASVLSQKYSVLKTEGNFNNEIGVPLTMLSIRDSHEAAVVEMGISDFGEMDRLGEIVCPDIVVMTNIGPCHLEKLGDLSGVLRAKSEVFKHIRPGGLAVLNSEDAQLNTIDAIPQCRIVRYGEGSDIYAEDIINLGLEGSDFTVRCENDSFGTALTLPGRHQIMNALAATAVGREFGLTSEEISDGISAAKGVSGRGTLVRTDSLLLVDDCYNANPRSMMAAIDMLRDALERRCAILGDMFELGADEESLHAQVGAYAAEQGLDVLVCIGRLSRHMYEAARESGKINQLHYFETKEQFLQYPYHVGFEKGDTVLIKASHGMAFNQITEAMKCLQL